MKRVLLLSLPFFPIWCKAQGIQPLSAGKGSTPTTAKAAEIHRDAIMLQGEEWVVPELIIGGEWTTSITLTNRGAQAIPTTDVYFVDNLGNPLSATFQTSAGNIITDVGFSFSLGVGGILEATFFGTSNTQFGSGIVGCSSAGCGTLGLYAEVTLTNTNSTRPDFQSVFPFEEPAALQYMLFDGRNGLTTTLYLVNNSTSATTVSLGITDANNNLVTTVPIPMNGLTSQILSLSAIAPQTIGIQGTLVVSTTNGALATITALRINPTNSFTPVRAFVAQ